MRTKVIDLGLAMARVTGSKSGFVRVVVCVPASDIEGVHTPAQSADIDIAPDKMQDFINALADATR